MHPKFLSAVCLELLLRSARCRALAAGLAIGIVAGGLFVRADDSARWMAMVVIAAGIASVACFAADAAPRGARRRMAERALLFSGSGVVAALQVASLLG